MKSVSLFLAGLITLSALFAAPPAQSAPLPAPSMEELGRQIFRLTQNTGKNWINGYQIFLNPRSMNGEIRMERVSAIKPANSIRPARIVAFQLEIPQIEQVTADGFAWPLVVHPTLSPDSHTIGLQSKAVMELALKNAQIRHLSFQMESHGGSATTIYFHTAEDFQRLIQEVDQVAERVQAEGLEAVIGKP